jgi:methylthioribose-1-phosphate isomerase
MEWKAGRLRLLDQTLLPYKRVVLDLDDYRKVVQAIREMRVRGAPLLGLAAAYAMAMAARQFAQEEGRQFQIRLEGASQEIVAARPTAVNISWAVRRMLALARSFADPIEASQRLLSEAQATHAQDLAINQRIGRHGATLLVNGGSVLTHCNTGALATGGYGTALGVIRAAWEEGKRFRVYHTETRPFLQGARLTAWELVQLGIPATMVVDSAAGFLLKEQAVKCVVVGADRIAANGDTANKIGTYPLAVVAKENGISFYVAAPCSTIDLSLASGQEIPIEERDPAEVTHLCGVRTAAEGIEVRNPSFDITPHQYISAIITEEGVVRSPYTTSLASAVTRAQRGSHAMTETLGDTDV